MGLPDIMRFAFNAVDAPIEGRALGINEASAASQSMLVRVHNPCHSDPREGGGRNLKVFPFGENDA